MSTIGWDDASLDTFSKIDFTSSPLWLRLLALTPVLEKFAYPIAIRRGFGTIWVQRDVVIDRNLFLSQGWQVKIGEPDNRERILNGSLATLSAGFHSVATPRPRFTRLGRELAWRKAIHKANGRRD